MISESVPTPLTGIDYRNSHRQKTEILKIMFKKIKSPFPMIQLDYLAARSGVGTDSVSLSIAQLL